MIVGSSLGSFRESACLMDKRFPSWEGWPNEHWRHSKEVYQVCGSREAESGRDAGSKREP
jgi:hypothetical protein